MLRDILFAGWFMLPAAIANATPIFAAVTPGLKHWKTTLDGGRTYRGKLLFGEHKTWRGIVSGMLVATLLFWLQQYLVASTDWASYLAGGVDYASLPTLILGPLFGLGALGGDAVESFFKRQKNIPAGKPWLPFDQLDYIIGAILVSLPFVVVSLQRYAWMIVIWFGMHLLASYIGWLFHLKDEPI